LDNSAALSQIEKQKPAGRRALVLRSAAITPLYLIGSFFVGAMLGSAVASGLPGHLDDSTRSLLAAIPALASVIAGGALWGRAMGRLAHAGSLKRFVWAGALGYGPTVILVALGLTVMENVLVEQRRLPDLPIHVVFTLLFVPAAFIVAAAGALAIGVALKRTSLIPTLALGSGLAAALVFLIVDLAMDAVGYRVGAPRAAERLTMLTVMLTGNLAASLAAGAFIGFTIGRELERPNV
jgi:hypothetical protein